MSHLKDMTNERIGRLLVVERAENTEQGQAQWLCVCECGKTSVVRGGDLRNGKVLSCGCYKIEQQTKHGNYNDKLYRVWTSMKNRCTCKTNKWYPIYGGKGVSICLEWNDYTKFRDWSIENGYKEGLTIDRIDFNGNYEPSNCRWITHREQQYNKSTNVFIQIGETTKTLTEWCKEYNVPISTARARIKRGLKGINIFVKQDA